MVETDLTTGATETEATRVTAAKADGVTTADADNRLLMKSRLSFPTPSAG